MDRESNREAALRARDREHWGQGDGRGASRSLFARPTHAAGHSWRKFEGGLDPRFPVKPWYAYRAGKVGILLIYASVSILVAYLLPA